jgi:hypothetical protein
VAAHVWAAPPHFPTATRSHVLGPEPAIARRMPLRSQLRQKRRKRGVRARSLACTVGAAAATRAIEDRRAPLMRRFRRAPPPHDLHGSRAHPLWTCSAVELRVPLAHELWMQRRQRGRRRRTLASAVWAARTAHAVMNLRLPLVAALAPPPHASRRPWAHCRNRNLPVHRRVPLSRQLRMHHLKRRLRSRNPAAAIRASRALRPLLDLRLPLVALLALPPHAFVASPRNINGAQRTVSRRMPLSSEATKRRQCLRALRRSGVA